MKIGARIQALRKQAGMSQEDLANKLSATRQTISQWETGQTIPSLDNIYRLKDIFGVSFDFILSEEDETEESEQPPQVLDSFTIKYVERDVKQANRLVMRKQLNSGVICVVILLFLIVFYALNDTYEALLPDYMFGIFFVILVFIISFIIRLHKNNKKSIAITSVMDYVYSDFGDHFTITCRENGNDIRCCVLRSSDVAYTWQNNEYTVFMLHGQLYILKNELLKNKPKLRGIIFAKKPYADYSVKPYSCLSAVLLVLSAASIFLGLAFISIDSIEGFPFNSWVFYLFLPLPLSSVIFGIIQCKRGLRYKRNIIVGVIFSILLCIYGSFCFVFSTDTSPVDADAYAVLQIESDEYGTDLNCVDGAKRIPMVNIEI